MANNSALNLALGSLAVTAASLWALLLCRDLRFASAAFLLYTLLGACSVLDYAMSDSSVRKFLNNVFRWAQPLYLPLLAAEALLFAGLQPQFALCALVCPLFYLVMTELLRKRVRSDLLDLSAILSALAVCYAAYTSQDIAGGVFALLGLAAFIGSGSKLQLTLEHVLLVTVVDLTALQFFKHYFKF